MPKEKNIIRITKKGKEMPFTKYLLIFLFPFTFVLSSAIAQETIPITGGNATGSGGSVSYTIGQTFYMTNTGSNGSVAEGVQQPFEISVVIGIEEASGITLLCSAYPNPTSDFLTLKVENFNFSDLSFQLFDTNGKLMETKKIESNESTISMTNLVTATYFLKIIQSKQEIKMFKIIKW
jgi:hypothetical protein